MSIEIKSRTGATLYITHTAADVRAAVIEAARAQADLSEADLSGADLSEADLSGADLSEADLSRADLSRADLSGADLSGADLDRADLSGADLSGADLSGAYLSGAYLSRAYLHGNRLADGTRINHPQDWLTLGPVGSENVTIVLHRTETGHGLNVGCWAGTVDGLAAEVSRRAESWTCDPATRERWLAEYAAIETLCRARIAGWSA